MIKKLVLTFVLCVICSSVFSMELLVKVGDKYPVGHPNHESGWRDGHIIDIRENGFHTGKMTLNHHCVIQVQGNFWAIRGTTSSREDWKSTKPSVMALKKFLSVQHNGKYRWENGYNKPNELHKRKRDYFVDYKDLLDNSMITQQQYDAIYNKEISQIIVLNVNMNAILKHEDVDIRKARP